MQTILPAINATLNGTSGVLLLIAYILIRRRKIQWHKRFMLAACVTSLVFLACYVLNHILRHGVVTHFTATGFVRPLYFTILTSHTILAVVIVPLIFLTFYRAFRGDFARHRRIARVTLPLWLYVSVTGVIVYLMLYHFYPHA